MKKPIPFGKYLLLERVNVGGMAEVFKAKAFGVEGFERLLAVKRILPSIAEDQEFITMFVDEAKIAVQLTHANIAQIFDLGKVGDSYFIALEYVHGKDLRAIFDRARKRGETVPVPMACYISMKMCEGLDYAHNKKDAVGRELHLVHRDVSPQNILLSYDGEIKVIDFGIAKAAGKAGQTQAGILKGKFGYMSPEQVRGGTLDRRSDIFACGIVLYELLTGERLFVGESDFSTLEKVRNVEIMPPSTYNRRIPEELEHIVLKALAKETSDRYQTAMDLHDDLQSFMYTSGNFFSRKDLSSYMRKAFADEIAKESAREEEYRRMEAELQQPTADVTQEALPVRPVGAPSRVDGPARPPPPKRTLVGGMTVPPPPPPRATSAPPVPPPQPPPTRPPSSPALNMEWDEDELSTQIYDKPDPSLLLPEVPAEPRGGRPIGAPSPFGLEARPASGPLPLAAPPQPMAGPIGGAVASSPPQMAAPVGAPSPFTVEPVREPTAVVPHSTASRSGMGWVLALASLIACAVLGIGAYIVLTRPGSIQITTNPAVATVLVDGLPAATGNQSPFQLSLPPGAHTIEVRSEGHVPWSSAINVSPGQPLVIPPLNLQPVPAVAPTPPTPPPAQTGTGFALDTIPSGAQVWVGDRLLEQRTPVQVTDLAPGTYPLRVEHPAYAAWGTTITLQAGQMQQLQAPTLNPRNINIAFASEPDGAEVTLVRGAERVRVGVTPITSSVDGTGGEWTVAMTRRGYEDYSAPLGIPAGATSHTFTGTLNERRSAARPPRPPQPPGGGGGEEPAVRPDPPSGGTGTLRVQSNPWSQVRVDGRLVGNTPQTNISLSAGSHRVELTNPELNLRRTFTVDIEAGQVVTRREILTE